ncbi:uncharacterized protein LOC144634461 [Oculina patagonica]
MELLKTTGEIIFVDKDLYPDSFFYQVLDQAFLGVDGSMVYIPKDIPRNRKELLSFLALKKGSSTEQRKTEEIESTKAHDEEAMSELHYTPEIQLLELVQEALMDNSTQLAILKPFHTLCLHLLSASNVPTSAEFKATLRLHDHQRQKRSCQDMSHDPEGNDCYGMCGKGCSCWKFVCGDCCWHQGCYEHDRCCDEKGYFHEYCLRTYKHDFSCSGYGAYPNCLS